MKTWQHLRKHTAELADAFTLAMYRDATGTASENEYDNLFAKYDGLFETSRIREMRGWTWTDTEEGRIRFALKDTWSVNGSVTRLVGIWMNSFRRR